MHGGTPTRDRIAHENLERWRRLHGTLSRANGEWEQILKRPWCEIREILLLTTPKRVSALRSSHPFVGIVTEEERLAIIERHPPPWPFVPYDPAKIPPEVMEKILSEGMPACSDNLSPPRRRRSPP